MPTPLFLLQHTCLLVCTMMALTLLVSRLHHGRTNAKYEKSRYLQCAAMLLLAVHYFLQMHYSIRAGSNEMGMMVNMLFYAPAALLMSLSMLVMESTHTVRHKVFGFGLAGCLGITVLFVAALCCAPVAMRICRMGMHVLFAASLILFIAVPVIEIRKKHRRIIADTGGDVDAFSRYTWSAYLILCTTSASLTFAILGRPMLFVLGPFVLLSLFLYTLSFVALGFNLAPVAEALADESETAESPADAASMAAEKPFDLSLLHDIEQAVARWCEEGGFRDHTMNMYKLSQQIHFERGILSRYFKHHLHATFRVWLSDLRFREAQRLMLAHPEYGNDMVSDRCGFSSRSQLYKIFSDKLGMTPREWRETQMPDM